MPDANTAAAAGFQNAEAYEKVMGRWSRRLAPLLIRFGGLSDGDRVLDVGCGTGSLTFTVPEIANTQVPQRPLVECPAILGDEDRLARFRHGLSTPNATSDSGRRSR